MQLQFDQVAFSGGGIRCFWHGGFLSQVGSFGDLKPRRVTGVSGGALSAACWVSGRENDLLDLMCEAFELNDSHIASGRKRLTPHQEIYRAVVDTTLDDEAIEAIAEGPEFEIAVATPPRVFPTLAAAGFYGLLYQLDQQIRSTPHLVFPKKLGLEQKKIDARQAARDGQLIDLICAAATIPPIFAVREWEGQRVLDGGICEKVLIAEQDEGETLVLLTRRYRDLPSLPNRTYVQPSSTVSADKVDFTDAAKVTDTWDQGARDAKRWLADRE